MRLGLNLGYWGAGNDADNLALAREADRLGYAVVVGRRGVRLRRRDRARLGRRADRAHRHRVGAVFQIPARTPAMTAMTAATLDTLSGGRFRLGLGVSGPQVSEGWHGVRFDKPLARTREYVEIVRLALRARDGDVRGRSTGRCRCPDGPGKALRLTVHPVRDDIPIYLAAIGPKNLELTGEIADGWLAHLLRPRARRGAAGARSAGRAASGPARRLAGFDVVPTVPVVVGDRRARRAPSRVAALRRAVRRRHGQPGAELLQPLAVRMGYERGGGPGAGPLPGPAAPRRGRGGAVRVHRPDVADRPPGAHRDRLRPTPRRA